MQDDERRDTLSRAVRRRHSFRYSRRSSLAAVAGAGGMKPAGKAYFLRREVATAVPNCTHGGIGAQTSQASQVVHLGVSPKWRQIWRWRQAFDSTKFLIWW